MKTINLHLRVLALCIVFCAVSITGLCDTTGPKKDIIAVRINNITSAGYAILYAGLNPIDIISFGLDDAEVYSSPQRFYGYKKSDIRILFEQGEAKSSFEYVAAKGLLDLKTLNSIPPTKAESIAWIKAFEDILKKKDISNLKKIYFSKTNPDLEFPNTNKRMSDMIEAVFKSSKEIKLGAKLYFWEGKNYTMISGKGGYIEVLVDGKKNFLFPIFICKQTKNSKIETL